MAKQNQGKSKPVSIKTTTVVTPTKAQAYNQSYKTYPLDQAKPWYETWGPYAIISGLCIALYAQTYWFLFTGLDDSFFLVVYQGYFADVRNFMRGFKESGVLDYYRPLLFGTMIMDFQVSKTDPWFYHVTNVIYHLIGCLALYKMLIKLEYERIFALLTTLLFTLHPLWSMAVAWIPGRNDPLVTLLVLWSFNFFLDYVQKGNIIGLMMHLLLYTAGLYTKETPYFIPFVFITYFFIFTKWQDSIRKMMTIGVGWSVIGLVFLAMRAEALELANKNGTRFTSIIYGNSWIKNLPDWPEYIGKFTFPLNLSNFPKFSVLSTTVGIVCIIAWVVVLYLSKSRNNQIIAFFTIWFLLFFGPATIFIFADSGRYDYLEHRFHLPAVTFIVFLNEALRSFFSYETSLRWRKLTYFTLMLLSGVLFVYTFIHSRHFKDPMSFWKKAVQGAPQSSQVYRGMGKVYYDAGDLKNAEVNFMRAVELNKAEVNTISDLGKAYESQRDLESAERCYLKTLEVDSNNVLFLTDLARIYEKKGMPEKAEIQYNKVLMRDPNFWQAKFGLGVIYYQRGRLDLSERLWLDVVRLNPSYNDTYINLAVLYYYTQNFQEAIKYIDLLKSRGVNVEQINPGLYNSLNAYRKK